MSSTDYKEHLDRTERFIEWLRDKMGEAGVTAEELCRQPGMVTYSYLSKFLTTPARRHKYGDDDKRVGAPRQADWIVVVLDYLGEKLKQPYLRSEGLIIWGLPVGTSPPSDTLHSKDALLGSLLGKLSQMEVQDLQAVHHLASRLVD